MQFRRLLPGKGFCGYLLYTFAFTLFMLWLLFPADTFKAKLESELNSLSPDIEWQVQNIHLAPPAGLNFIDLEVYKSQESETLFKVEKLTLFPDFSQWKKDRTWVVNSLFVVPAGRMNARFQLHRDQVRMKALMKAIQLGHSSLNHFFQPFERQVTGLLEGNFTSTWLFSEGMLGEVDGDFTIHDGELSLQDAVLGMKELVFERMSGHLRYHEGILHLSEGRMESRLLAAEFTGTLHPSSPFAFSQVDIQGVLQPRPEFLATLGNVLLANMLTRQLRDGKLPFIITGTVQEPGISFRGLPEDFNRQLQSVGR
jgi:type II secretion system protein N